MKVTLDAFEATKDFLVCVDSDGCAMDTMDVKHKKYFGPKAVEVWNLQKIEDDFLKVWNDVNLYTRTRGINRFKGLVMVMELMAEKVDMPDVSAIKEWTETADELSNPSLEREIEKTDNSQLKKALQWSNAVNEGIKELAGKDKPFPGVKEGLEAAAKVSDVVIVSSANTTAVRDEWTRHQLDQYVKVLLGQEAGTKAACISDLKNFNYENQKILMVGDAPGDLEAARQNGVFYYPILVGKELFSWERFRNEALKKLVDGTFDEVYQQQLIDEFYSNLK